MTETMKATLTPIIADSVPPSKFSSTAQLQNDCGYYKAQELLQDMLNNKLISTSEFNKITILNRQAFSPYLVEIMPEITG